MNLSEDLFITCGHGGGGQQRTDPFPYRHLEPPTEMMKMKYSVGSGHAVLARGGIVAKHYLVRVLLNTLDAVFIHSFIMFC